MKKPKSFHKKPELLGTELEGLLVARYGNSAEIEDAQGRIIRCHLRKNLDLVMAGDHVLYQMEQDGTGTIINYLPRKSVLARPEHKGKIKPVAANIDAMVIVTAPPPILSEHMIDRYIVAAENLHITPILLLNKIDLLTDENRAEVSARLAIYEKIGYKVIFSSTYTQDGLEDLHNFLKDKTSVLVGQSGVGKSSIIAAFVQEQLIRVGETSAHGLGKHTTTMARLYHLPNGGNIIDSPGVREFGIWNMTKDEIQRGFIEFKSFADQCKFRDCQHSKEPQCAVRKAVAEGDISQQRFDSFQEMVTAN